MNYSIVYSSKTGNTRRLAETLRELLPQAACVYNGVPADAALAADLLYVGFWTDKGSCDAATGEFLTKLRGKRLFLFGTAGFGGEESYFDTILEHTCQKLDDSNTVIGTYMCQGKMPVAVRERYEKMRSDPAHALNLEHMIENFDQALSHPDKADLEHLKMTVLALTVSQEPFSAAIQ
jgi:flavodoxin I